MKTKFDVQPPKGAGGARSGQEAGGLQAFRSPPAWKMGRTDDAPRFGGRSV